MNAADIMTRDVVCAAPDTSIPDVVRLLLKHRISGLPVVEAGAVVGVISEGDLVRRAAAEVAPRHHSWLARLTSAGSIAADYVHHHGSRARDLMTTPAVTVPADMSVGEIAALMQRRSLKRLPVIDADGMLAGIVTRANLLQAMASRTVSAPTAPMADAELREALLAHIAAQPWAGGVRGANVIVIEGVVHLWGAVPDPAARRAIIVAAETLPGTRAVADHFDTTEDDAVDPLDRPNWPAPGRP